MNLGDINTGGAVDRYVHGRINRLVAYCNKNGNDTVNVTVGYTDPVTGESTDTLIHLSLVDKGTPTAKSITEGILRHYGVKAEHFEEGVVPGIPCQIRLNADGGEADLIGPQRPSDKAVVGKINL